MEKYLLVLENRDGEEVDRREYDTLHELLNDWPYAEYLGGNEYSAWVGGGR